MDNLILGFSALLDINRLLSMVVGTFAGIWIGALPGLGPTAATVIILPFTYYMDPLSALLLVASIYSAAGYSGSVSSILINIPGEAMSAATAFDGYPMAQQGRARVALGISLMASLVGALVGVGALVFLSGPITTIALMFSPAEYFSLSVLGLVAVSSAGGRDVYKGLVMCALGVGISFVGVDQVIGVPRYTFDILSLQGGISMVAVMVGLFAIPEAVEMMLSGGTISRAQKLSGRLWDGFVETFRYPRVLSVTTFVGLVIGVIPGIGATTANFVCYDIARRISRTPELFGKGAPEGIIAPETSNNACICAGLIPTLTLGIPGGATSAVLLIVLTVQGIRPGAMLFTSQPELVYGFFAGLFVASILFFVMGAALTSSFALLTTARNEILAPIVMVASLIGAYSYQQSGMDVAVAIITGSLGFFLKRYKFPLVGIVMGMVLGNLAEVSFHQALMMTGGSYTIFVVRPLSGVLLGISVLLVAWPLISRLMRNRRLASTAA
jgi:putative tricarboxylic transport membrane protein